MGKARDEQRLARALRGAGLGALTLLLGIWALSGGGGGGRFDSGIDFDGRFEDSSSGSYVPFGAVRTEGTRRPLRPLEMCSWETTLEASQYDEAVEGSGFPTKWEQQVWDRHPLEDVTCPVCGKHNLHVSFPGSDLREEGRCSQCGSYNRLRQLADIVLPEASRLTGRRLQALQDLVHTDLRILNTQCRGVLHKVLRQAPGYVCSEYINADVAAGSVVEGIRHEDLQRTTFNDDAFDLVLSSDLMSRIPRPYQGFHELRRILRPGGAHVFTVPFSPNEYHDQIRAVVEDGKLVHWALPPIYQGDHLHPKGVLMFTIFGREMADKLCMLGYNTTVHHLHNPAHAIIGNNAWVVNAVKNTERP